MELAIVSAESWWWAEQKYDFRISTGYWEDILPQFFIVFLGLYNGGSNFGPNPL